jgi:hypothetical protein
VSPQTAQSCDGDWGAGPPLVRGTAPPVLGAVDVAGVGGGAATEGGTSLSPLQPGEEEADDEADGPGPPEGNAPSRSFGDSLLL